MTTSERVRILIGTVSYLTEQMAADLLGWNYSSVRRLVSQKKIKVRARLGKAPLLKESEVIAYAKVSSWKSRLTPDKPWAPGAR